MPRVPAFVDLVALNAVGEDWNQQRQADEDVLGDMEGVAAGARVVEDEGGDGSEGEDGGELEGLGFF